MNIVTARNRFLMSSNCLTSHPVSLSPSEGEREISWRHSKASSYFTAKVGLPYRVAYALLFATTGQTARRKQNQIYDRH